MIDIVVEGLDHPEGVAWGPDGFLYAGGEAGQIYRIDVDARSYTQLCSTGGFSLGLALDAESAVYVCDLTSSSVLRVTQDGAVSTYSSGSPARPMVTPNYPVFDHQGNLYVSDSGQWSQGGGGCVYLVRPGGTTSVWSTQASRFANGMALSRDGDYLYVVESLLPGVIRIPILGDGSAGVREVVLELPESVPDGLAFTAEGTLLIACYRPDRIYALDSAGRLSVLADDPLGTDIAAPTNVAFGRADLRSLFIASLGRWHVAELRLDSPGLRLHYPEAPVALHGKQ